jgi:protein-tyrosine phosphatase
LPIVPRPTPRSPRRARIIDIHTHLVPSGDDGVATVEEGFALCRQAATRGTSLLYGTPHVNADLPLTSQREGAVRADANRLAKLLEAVGLEFRVGFEVHPTVTLQDPDLMRYRLDGLDAMLLECPLESGTGFLLDQIFAAAERIESAGLLPVLAHPERSPAFLMEQDAAADAARRGWLLQVTGASVLGQNGDAVTRFTWSLLERGNAQLVASDAHRPDRPPFLDEALALLSQRLGRRRGLGLLDGTALEFAMMTDPASPGDS